MTFTQLRVLQAVARTGNMTRAAEELATTQPAVSHALRSLERELGVSLFIRRHTGVTLTAGNDLAAQPAVTITDLARYPFIMSTAGCEPLITALAGRAGAHLRCHYRVRDTNSILAMVSEHLG